MDFLNRHKKAFITTLSVLCIIAIAITAGNKYNPTFVEKSLGFIIVPVQKLFTGIGSWFGDKIDFMTNMGDLEAENEKLRNEIIALQIDNSRLKNVDEENAKLVELLNIARTYSDYPMVGAGITSKDPGNWYNTFNVDKGERDGISRDMVVLAAGGLAGRVTKAGYNYAVIVTLIDDTSSVSAEGARTGDTGFVRGDTNLMQEGKCRMEFLSADSEIVVGDEIVTSNLSSIYPPGITIGYVTEVGADLNGTKYAIISPAVDFSRLKTVLVITELFAHQNLDTAPAEEK